MKFHDFLRAFLEFHDFPGLENENQITFSTNPPAWIKHKNQRSGKIHVNELPLYFHYQQTILSNKIANILVNFSQYNGQYTSKFNFIENPYIPIAAIDQQFMYSLFLQTTLTQYANTGLEFRVQVGESILVLAVEL